MTATMLEKVGGQIPTAAELSLALDKINTSAVELLQISLDRWREDEGVVLTAAQAWHLTDFARGVQGIGESLSKWGDEIESEVWTIYANNRDRLPESGGDDA
jgi:hypothetical protein